MQYRYRWRHLIGPWNNSVDEAVATIPPGTNHNYVMMQCIVERDDGVTCVRPYNYIAGAQFAGTF